MSIPIIWHSPRSSGVRTCEFDYHGEPVKMSAAVCVQNAWKDKPDTVNWLVDRDAWAQEHALIISERMDYAASAEGIKAKAQEDYDRLQADIDSATEQRTELKEVHPDLTESVGG